MNLLEGTYFTSDLFVWGYLKGILKDVREIITLKYN